MPDPNRSNKSRKNNTHMVKVTNDGTARVVHIKGRKQGRSCLKSCTSWSCPDVPVQLTHYNHLYSDDGYDPVIARRR